MLEKDDDLFIYALVVGKYAGCLATLLLAIRRETGLKSTQ